MCKTPISSSPAVATIGLIAAYTSLPFQKPSNDRCCMARLMTFFYRLIFVIIQNKDYSLLLGSLGVVPGGGGHHVRPRNIKWYADRKPDHRRIKNDWSAGLHFFSVKFGHYPETAGMELHRGCWSCTSDKENQASKPKPKPLCGAASICEARGTTTTLSRADSTRLIRFQIVIALFARCDPPMISPMPE